MKVFLTAVFINTRGLAEQTGMRLRESPQRGDQAAAAELLSSFPPSLAPSCASPSALPLLPFANIPNSSRAPHPRGKKPHHQESRVRKMWGDLPFCPDAGRGASDRYPRRPSKMGGLCAAPPSPRPAAFAAPRGKPPMTPWHPLSPQCPLIHPRIPLMHPLRTRPRGTTLHAAACEDSGARGCADGRGRPSSGPPRCPSTGV